MPTITERTKQEILIHNIADAVADTLRFALVENSLLFTTIPVDVREMADGSGRWAVFGTFCEMDNEVHTRRFVGAFHTVEIL